MLCPSTHRKRKEIGVVEGFIAVIAVFGILAVVGLIAQFGADSRPAYLDDWAREAAR
jgi:hypothetical protein